MAPATQSSVSADAGASWPRVRVIAPSSELALVQDAIGVVTWLWDVPAGLLQWFGDPSPLFGLPKAGFGGFLSDYLNLVHPQDRDTCRQRYIDCIKGELTSLRSVDRVIWPDRSLHWIEQHVRVVPGPDGGRQIAGVVSEVSDRVAAEQERAAADARFRQLIEQAPVAMCISRGECVVYGNASFAQMFGFEHAELAVGIDVLSLVAPEARDGHVDRTRRRQAGEAVEISYELPLRRVDGSRFHCLVSVTEIVLPDGPATLVFLHDLSDRVRARQALQQERDRARLYLDVAQAILIALDDQLRVTMLNRRGHQVLGAEDGSLIGADWVEQSRPEHDRARVRGVLGQIFAGEMALPEYHENSVLTRGGEQRRIAWRNTALRDEDGRLTGILSSGEDITGRVLAEESLRQLNTELEQRVAERTRQLAQSNASLAEARDAAEAATREKSRFVAHMSHEIRTPLNAIIGMTELALRQPDLPPRAQQYLGHVQTAGATLLETVNQVLDFSKIEAGRLELVNDAFDLPEVLRRVDAIVGGAAAAKGLSFRLELAAGLPRRWVGDAFRIGQVLVNLCGNAVKFTERGEVLLAVGSAPGGLSLRVHDTGPGIESEALVQLFQPFRQVDASITRRHGGTGLGLVITRQIVEHMGGRIEVHSEPGQGSRFEVLLPLVPAPPDARDTGAAVADVPGDAAEGSLRGCRILLVEDNELNRIVAGDLLRDVAGAEVHCAENGEQALQALAQQDVDVVLMDLQMPLLDGFETTRRLRADPRHAGVPVVAMSAHALADDRQRCLELGMNAFVTKPYDPPELFSVLARLVGRRGRPGPAAPAAVAGVAAPVSFERGLARCMGRRELYQTVLRRFAETRADDAGDLRRRLQAGDARALAQRAHSLVSSAGTIGAERLSELARQLEQCAGGADMPALGRTVDALALELARVIEALRGHLEAAS